ncbi:MAG: TonB-dependent receptor [Acidobacteria bacterium]|nr:MAG: TonB-dependent receptor [Acidobacteriota bacterium]
MHKRGILISLLCLLLTTGAAVAGTITGKVTYEGAIPKLPPVQMNADPQCAAKHSEPVPSDMLVLGEGNGMKYIFVQVKNPPAGDHKPPAEPVVIDQVGCRYEPHVAGVMVGQKLLFKNSDGILHNVHGTPAKNSEFNIGMPPVLKEKDVTLNQPEPLFPVKCDVHPWMNAYVAVMSHPYFAVTGDDGTFKIDGVPAGTYTVEVWHERLGTKSAEVTVDGSGTATVNFTLSPPKRR